MLFLGFVSGKTIKFPGKYLSLGLQNPLLVHVGRLRRPVVGFLDLFINIVLEVQNKKYSQILYLIDNVVPGLHFW